MQRRRIHRRMTVLAGASFLVCGALFPVRAQTDITPAAAPDHPSVTVQGNSYPPLGILRRNMGAAADQLAPFPPHRIIGNIYYVGSKTLSTFLIVTTQGNILINTSFEANVPVIARSVAQLGFKIADTKIILGDCDGPGCSGAGSDQAWRQAPSHRRSHNRRRHG